MSTSVEWYVNHLVQKHSQSKFEYDRLEHTGNRFIFHKLNLQMDDSALESEFLEIAYSFNLWKRELDLELKLTHPKIEISKKVSQYGDTLIPVGAASYLLNINGKIEIDNGELIVREGDEVPKKMTFSALQTWGKHLNGELKFGFDKGVLVLSDEGTSNGIQFKMHMDNVETNEVSHFLEMFQISPWKSSKGIVNGDLTIVVPQAYRSYGEGFVHLQGVDLDNPDSGVGIYLDDAHLRIEPGTPTLHNQEGDWYPTMLGELQIQNSSSIRFEQLSAGHTEINNLSGKVSFLKDDRIEIGLGGILIDPLDVSEVAFNAQISYPSYSKASGECALQFLTPNKAPVVIQLSSHDYGLPTHQTQVDLQNFGVKEYAYLRQFIQVAYPTWDSVLFYHGDIDASLKLSVVNGKVHDVAVDHMSARNLKMELFPWDINLAVDEIAGSMNINLGVYDPKDTLNADLVVKNGSFQFVSLQNQFWQFSNIQTKLMVSQGVVQRSDASVELGGLKGSAILDLSSPNEIMKLKLSGTAIQLAHFFPEKVQQVIRKKFLDEALAIDSTIYKSRRGVKVKGELKAQDIDKIDFGFDLEGASAHMWGTWPPPDNALEFWEEAEVLLRPLIGPYLVEVQKLRWIRSELGVGGLVIRNGWFKAADFPLNTYVDPFLFAEEQLKLTGTADIQGFFDHQGMSLHYNARNGIIENKDLRIDLKELASNRDVFPASHYIDFTDGKHFGSIPLNHASYLDKKSGLHFKDVTGDAIFEGEKVHLVDVETYAEGIYFAGGIEIDYGLPEKGNFDVEIYSHTMMATIPQAREFFHKLKRPIAFLEEPLSGKLSFSDEGAHLKFSFHPDDYDFDGVIHGVFYDGKLKVQHLDIDLQDLSLNIDYDITKNTLNLTDWQGVALVGGTHSLEEYFISGDGVRFSNFRDNLCKFDVQIHDKKKEVLRLAGFTEGGKHQIDFKVDKKLSHFGTVNPDNLTFVMRDWTQIEEMQLDMKFKLSSFLYDVQRMSRTGLFGLSHSNLDKLNSISHVGGDFHAMINYDGEKGRLNFDVQGKDVFVDSHHFMEVLLNGYKREDEWVIDQLQLDQLSVAANLTKKDDLWKSHFLGVRYGNSLLAGLEGEYLQGEKELKAKINLLEVDLGKLGEFVQLQSFVEDFSPQGQMKGVGDLKITFPEKGEPLVDASLTTDFRNPSLKGFKLSDADHVSCHVVSNKGITFRQIESLLLHEDTGLVQAGFTIDKIGYNIEAEGFQTESFKFRLPVQNLGWLASSLKTKFPDLVNPTIETLIADGKSTGEVRGNLSLQFSPLNKELQIQLGDGNYKLLGSEHLLKNFNLLIGSDEIEVTTQYQLNQHLFWVTGRSNMANLDAGQIILEDSQNESLNLPPLVIEWKNDPERGVVIEGAHGMFCGVYADLDEDETTPHAFSLAGEMRLDCSSVKQLLSTAFSEPIENWEIGQGYTLRGKWNLAKEDLQKMHFHGSLEGDSFELKGMMFNNLRSHLSITPDEIQVHDLHIIDPSLHLSIEKLMVAKSNNDWVLNIPKVQITDLTPSLLYEIDKGPPKQRKPLVVENLEINRIRGVVGEPDTFSGVGTLAFVNPVKKNLQNTIFAIPAEILSRIGLDLSVLTPVSGSVDFYIKDNRVNLARFKDVYSDGKLSKFYLPTGSVPYMDFDGNLDIQVRMKQYNLIFKLAELFTVNINGTLKKPTYSLQRQKK